MSEPEKVESSAPEKEAITWSCQAQVFDREPVAPLDQLYVGDKYLLHCSGEFVEEFDVEKLKLSFADQEQMYTVHLLGLRTFENTEMWVETTSYKPGEHKLEGAFLTDGSQKVQLSLETPLVVQSELKNLPPEAAMSPEAQQITFLGPFSLAVPLWFWLALVFLVVAVAGLAMRYFYRRFQKKKLIEELKKHSTALNPYSQFHKEVRQAVRKYTAPGFETLPLKTYMEELDKSFRMFLVREFLIPAMEWRTSAVMSELKDSHKKTYRYAGPQVRKLLVEFDRAKSAGEKNRLEDCEQMIDMSRRVVDRIQKIRRVEK